MSWSPSLRVRASSPSPKAEQVSATVTEYVEDESVTAGGTEYKYAYANDKTEGSYDLKADYDLYLDAYGYVIYAPAVEVRPTTSTSLSSLRTAT